MWLTTPRHNADAGSYGYPGGRDNITAESFGGSSIPGLEISFRSGWGSFTAGEAIGIEIWVTQSDRQSDLLTTFNGSILVSGDPSFTDVSYPHTAQIDCKAGVCEGTFPLGFDDKKTFFRKDSLIFVRFSSSDSEHYGLPHTLTYTLKLNGYPF